MSGSRSVAALLALTATLVLSLLAVSPALAGTREGAFHLRVGPGVTASITTSAMHISCGVDANCVFDVPTNATFDVVASAPRREALRWTGCSSQPDTNRCRVVMRNEPVLVTVR